MHVVRGSLMQKARAASSEKPKVTLSCEQCRQRKTRCDKKHPCGSCQRSDFECTLVHRHRLPRGRAGTDNAKDAELKFRITKLEKILAEIQSSGDSRAVPSKRFEQNAYAPPENGQDMDNERNDESFWASLNGEVAGIREMLEDLTDGESDSPSQGAIPSATSGFSSHDFDLILFGPSTCTINPALLEVPSRPIVVALLNVYVYRVDSILKLSHTPSLRDLLLSGESANSELLKGPSYKALKFAVCFTAACTLSEAESRAIFGEDKDKIVNKFRLATEVALSQAKLLTTSDFRVLQAFVIYLAGRRTCNGYKKIWTLIASAVRIGQSLGLDTDENGSRTPFQMEMRRRLWYSIGLLDMQAAFDGGSHSVIASNGLLGRPPLNIDDSDISPTSDPSALVEHGCLTSMSFSCMTHEALICWRKLTHVPTDCEGQTLKIRQEWSKRYQIVLDWEKNMNERYLQHCDTTQPFQKFMKIVGQDMIVSKKLLLRRPMHRLFSAGPPPADDFNVLEVATDVVERSLQKFVDPSFAAWSWFGWVKWYVLAIVLAELCGHGNGPLIDKAWKVAEEAFPRFAELIIDDDLWRSVEKLMQKARSTRDNSLRSVLSMSAPVCTHEVSVHKNSSGSAGFNEGENHLRDNQWAWQVGNMRANDGCSQSNQEAEPPSVTARANCELLPEYMDTSVPETWVDEPEYMSWVNWGLFVQDLGDLNEQDGLNLSF